MCIVEILSQGPDRPKLTRNETADFRNQVAPAELEAILLSHPKVDDAAVEGIFFEDEATEYPAAYIVTADQVDNYQTLQREVQTYVDNQVAAYKHLRGGVNIVASIPRK